MKQLELLAGALEFIETNLSCSIKTNDIADACFCSKSTLEKLFRCINNITIREYIQRRRMTLAAKELIYSPSKSLLEIALSYGYSSNEAFTRSFEQIWNCKPSSYRKEKRYYELFPRLLCPLEIGDDYMDTRKHVDISELYDLFQERRNCFIIGCDIKDMVAINEISRAAGDAAIIETLNRLYNASGAEDIAFRIGGDEFVILTNSREAPYAEQILQSIVSQNGTSFTYDEQKIPLTLYCSISNLENTKKYFQLFTDLHTMIRESKSNR